MYKAAMTNAGLQQAAALIVTRRTQRRHAETGIVGRMRRLTGEKAAHPFYQLNLDESSRG